MIPVHSMILIESKSVSLHTCRHFYTAWIARYNLHTFGWDDRKKIYIPFYFLLPLIRRLRSERFTCRTRPFFLVKHTLPAFLIICRHCGTGSYVRACLGPWALDAIADTCAHARFSARLHMEQKVKKLVYTNRYIRERGQEYLGGYCRCLYARDRRHGGIRLSRSSTDGLVKSSVCKASRSGKGRGGVLKVSWAASRRSAKLRGICSLEISPALWGGFGE